MVKSNSPTLAVIKNKTSLTSVRALISLAICEVCDFFNVGKNMNDTQVALTADLIVENFWYLKLEEIKYCFRRAMRRERLYDRLDGNIILGWLQAYDDERTEEAMRVSEQMEAEAASKTNRDANTISFDEYCDMLSSKAQNGDEVARKELEEIKNRPLSQNPEDLHNKELEFFKWKQQFYTRHQL